MNIEKIVENLSIEETREMALSCMIEMSDAAVIDLIKEFCLHDRIFIEELVANLEES